MKLGNRAILLISPVIILACSVASIGSYLAQKSTIEKKEKLVVEGELVKLRAAYNELDTFATIFMISTQQSNLLRQFLFLDSSDRYIMGNNLNLFLDSISLNKQQELSLVISQDNGEILYYYSNSEDPFDNYERWEEDLINQFPSMASAYDKKLYINAKKTYLVHLYKIDFRELFSTVSFTSNDPKQTLLLLSAEMTQFNRLQNDLEEKYKSLLSIYHNNEHRVQRYSDDLAVSMPLSSEYSMIFKLPQSYLDQKIQYIADQVLVWFLLITLISIISLYILINRYITSPIALLERNLSKVIHDEKHEIISLKSDDELGKLSRTFNHLHSKLFTAYAKTVQMAENDVLTGVPNRLKFNDLSANAIREACEYQTSLSIMYIDLDNFKYVNDKYGHEVGDELLKVFCERLKSILELDYLNHPGGINMGRLGGDEFAVLVPNCDKMLATRLAIQILSLFRGGFRFELGEFPVTASIGVSLLPVDGVTFDELMMKADASMYQAKIQGKNQYSFYSMALAKQISRRTEVERALSKANFDQEFYLVYMPIIDGKKAKACGLEVLLRWKSPELGMVSPDEFITIAETNGAFALIDRWVIRKSFEDFDTLYQCMGDDFALSINISSAELTSPKILEYISEQAKTFNIPAKHIILEITETFEIKLNREVLSVLNKMNQAGYRLAIDDFGTGHTSLLQMIDYPAESIKFDKSLVEKLHNQHHNELAATLVNLCHDQKFTVTAEGIETEEQLVFMMNCGCDHFQGFWFSKPLKHEEIIEIYSNKEPLKKVI